MSHRIEQINETLRHELSQLIAEIVQPEWGRVTVTDVQVAPDLRHARIWVSASTQAIQKLNDLAPQLIHELRPRLRFKFIPTLTFLQDTGEVDRLTEILETIDES